MHRIFTATLSLLTVCTAQAQTLPALPPDQARIEALYRLTYRPDSTAAATRTETMRLQVGSKLSRFESLNAVRRDSMMNAAFAEAESKKGTGEMPTINLNGMSGSEFRTNFQEVIYKLPTATQVAVYDKIGTVRYAYQEPVAPLAWAIVPGAATVAGYACQRATAAFGGRTWEAWFTREVPVTDGPYKFYGLPGLIVKIADTRGHYTYELLKLRQLPAPAPLAMPEPGAKPIAKAEFVKGKAEYARTAFEQMIARGNIRFNTPEEAETAKQKARERAKRPTNPLELK